MLPYHPDIHDSPCLLYTSLGRTLRFRTSGTPGFHGLTGGVYKARERIHRAMADARLLANPASRSRVADLSLIHIYVVTAFETVYFWNDLPKAFTEVTRVLKRNGHFLICCELNNPVSYTHLIHWAI